MEVYKAITVVIDVEDLIEALGYKHSFSGALPLEITNLELLSKRLLTVTIEEEMVNM